MFIGNLRRQDILALFAERSTTSNETYHLLARSSATLEHLHRAVFAFFVGAEIEHTSCRVQRAIVADVKQVREPRSSQATSARGGWLEQAAGTRRLEVPETIVRMLPSWLAKVERPTTSRDPLGLQAIAGANADAILPRLSVATSRARYYSFVCWSIDKAMENAPDSATHRDRAYRLERLLVLCEALLHRDAPTACTYVGRRRGRAWIREHDGGRGWPLPSKILKDQATSGALRAYRTSLLDLGLVEEDDLGEGLGLKLTLRGQQLAAKYGERLDPSVVQWALDDQGRRKRWETLESTAAFACLSAERISRLERRYLVEALFGASLCDCSTNAAQRRETTRLLTRYGLIANFAASDEPSARDIALAGDEEDESTAIAIRADWHVVKGLLALPPDGELLALQQAAAYELFALSLNRLFQSMVDAVREPGRVPLARWLHDVAHRAGTNFVTSPASTWASPARTVVVADRLLEERTWTGVAAQAGELLVAVLRHHQLRTWLHEVVAQDTFLSEVLERKNLLDGVTPRALLEGLVRDLAKRHYEESVRKGKGCWIRIDDDHLVRAEPRPMRPMVHSLRFAQLGQLVADLELTAEEVADAP